FYITLYYIILYYYIIILYYIILYYIILYYIILYYIILYYIILYYIILYYIILYIILYYIIYYTVSCSVKRGLAVGPAGRYIGPKKFSISNILKFCHKTNANFSNLFKNLLEGCGLYVWRGGGGILMSNQHPAPF